MTYSQRKTWYFLFEGLTAFGSAFHASYLFFLLRDDFGFGNRDNLLVCAFNGLIYLIGSWQAGRFAQRFGCHKSLQVSFIGVSVCLLAGLLCPQAWAKLTCYSGWMLAMCFTWPAIEVLVTENEPTNRIPRMVGFYNITWSAGAAVAFLVGGAFFDYFGKTSIYWVPLIIAIGEIVALMWLDRQPVATVPSPIHKDPHHTPERAAFQQPVPPATFLKMAWLSNPFAYVATNTIMAVIPGLAHKLDLTVAQSGFFCSIWFFARTIAFVWLWRWTGWHYRFRWLLASFIGLIAGFLTLLLATNLWVVAAAQVIYGFAVGLIYYSSLFYSMDVGETKGEHGGLHEAAIGAGNFLGPGIGAIGLTLAPASPNASTWAVSCVLLLGLSALIWLRVKHHPRKPARPEPVLVSSS